ncbi:hypothetical protein KCU65_g5640, partial [Aureobasidium melanogenum]
MNNMKGDRLSVFVEANRFPPTINQHRYSVLRAEADAIAEQMLIIANKNKLSRASRSYEGPDMDRSSGMSVYELEANELSAGDQSPCLQSTEPPVLPRISMLSAFNPFGEPLSSPPSPVPGPLKPAVEADPVTATVPASSQPRIDYLPFIAPTAPFDPYKERYEAHPAGPYGAQRTLLPSPSQIPRKPLPPGAKPFPPVSYTPPGSPTRPLTSCVSYTPPGSPLRHTPRKDNTSPKIVSPVPKHTGRALLNTPPIRSPPSKQRIGRKSGPNLYKPLPPSPSPASSLRPVTAADRVRSNLKDVKDRFLDKLSKLSRL